MRLWAKHTTTLTLLLLAFAVGSRTLYAFGAWGCVEMHSHEEHHECCSCDCECHECDYHTQSLEGQCSSHGADREVIEATNSVVKLNLEKRVLILTYIISSSTTLTQADDYKLYNNHAPPARCHNLEWICEVGLLRAPPVC